MADQLPSGSDASSSFEADFGFHAAHERGLPFSSQPSDDASREHADEPAFGATDEPSAADADPPTTAGADEPGASDSPGETGDGPRRRRRRRGRRGRGTGGARASGADGDSGANGESAADGESGGEERSHREALDVGGDESAVAERPRSAGDFAEGAGDESRERSSRAARRDSGAEESPSFADEPTDALDSRAGDAVAEPAGDERGSRRGRRRRGRRGGRGGRDAGPTPADTEASDEDSSTDSATALPGDEPAESGRRTRRSLQDEADQRLRDAAARVSGRFPNDPNVASVEPAFHDDDEPLGDEGERADVATAAPETRTGAEGEGSDAGGRRRRRRRRGRGRGARDEAGAGADSATSSRDEPSFGDVPARRGRAESDELAADEADTDSAERRDDAEESALAEAPVERRDDDEAGGRERRRRRRGRRGGRRKRGERGEPATGPVAVEIIPGEDDEFQRLSGASGADELPELPDDAHLLAPEPSKRSRERQRRNEDDEPERPSTPHRKNVILVNAADLEEVRVAVVEGHHVVDFQMTARRHKSYVNDIYRGKVVNLEPAIGAAFIDFGEGRNGFLHTSDVLSAYGEADWSLEKLLTTKVDPEEWDAGSSQPHIGVEMSDDELRAHEAAHGGSADHGGDSADGGEAGESGTAEAVHAPVVVKAPAHPRESRRGHKRMRARPRLPITDLLKKGDTVVVQVTKDAIGDKGPTLTTYISIPGRYLVLMPSMSRTGVSRKIEDERERRRLKRILAQLDIPPGMGVIVRTAGTHASKADLKRDLDYLLLLWDSFGKRLMLGRGPAPLYEESDVAIRTIRDLFTPATEAVYVDDARVFERVKEFTEKLMPENVERIKLHEGTKPLFHAHNVEQEFERLFARRIDLPSGGSIVFDQAEALVAIDVNSGKTRSDGFDFEDIALKTNLDAVPEIARQIKLRDLGGIIVIDFIDMQRASSRRQIERAFRDAMDSDRARSKLGRISQFGLLELTRQRLGPGLVKMIFSNCPRCRGSGRLRTPESRAQAILRRLGAALALKGFTKVEVRTQPEVVEHLKRHAHDKLKQLETAHQREIVLCSVPEQVEDSVLRYLRADGREVRPGGRRKR